MAPPPRSHRHALPFFLLGLYCARTGARGPCVFGDRHVPETIPGDDARSLPLQKKAPLSGHLSFSAGAAYRIRTCDVLIRSQTLYPAEVTPQRKTYNAIGPLLRQARNQSFLKNFLTTLSTCRNALCSSLHSCTDLRERPERTCLPPQTEGISIFRNRSI